MAATPASSRGTSAQVAESDNTVIAGVSGAWAAAKVAGAMVSGFPNDATQVYKGDGSFGQVSTGQISGAPNDNRKGLKGTGAWSSDPQSIVTIGRGLLIESFDIGLDDATSSLSAGNAFWIGIGVPAGTTLTRIVTYVTTGSISVSHFWMGLYDTTLAQVRITADTPSAVNVASVNAFVDLPLTSSVAVAADTYLYAFIMVVGAAITTPTKSITTAALSGPFGANAYRGFTQTGLATPPTPAVPVTTALMRWLALY